LAEAGEKLEGGCLLAALVDCCPAAAGVDRPIEGEWEARLLEAVAWPWPWL